MPISDSELERQLRDFIRIEVRGGYTDAAEILARAVDVMIDDADAERTRPIARHVLEQEWASFETESQLWSEDTDCDWLDRAFADLETRGIVARSNFSCCGSCGHNDIRKEMEKSTSAGVRVRGYVFFDEQDTEAAVRGYGIGLDYGAQPFDRQEMVHIGNEIVSTFHKYGLKTEWDGRAETRIRVHLDWKRRRHG